MDLSTSYLGKTLKNPLVPSASPLTEDIGQIKQMEDSGAAAVVLHSLFEEQIRADSAEFDHHLTAHTDTFAEAQSFFMEPEEYPVGPEAYLNNIRRAKESVKIPVIASLNGTALGSWTDTAKKIQQAGADALELNIYSIPTDSALSGAQVEDAVLAIVKAVRSSVTIPVAVKLSPYFSSMASLAKRLDEEGVNGLVLFNRFSQPDIELESFEVQPKVILSTSQSIRLPLRWVAILHGKVKADLALTGGIHTGEDAVKAVMAGANVAMMCSSLLKHGIGHLKKVEQEMKDWMEKNGYESVKQMQGALSQKKCVDPSAFERAQYIRAIQSYRPVNV